MIEQMILVERLMQPKETAVQPDQEPQRVGQRAKFIIIAALVFRRAGIMNIAYNSDRTAFGHARNMRNLAGSPKIIWRGSLPSSGRHRHADSGDGAFVRVVLGANLPLVLLDDFAGDGQTEAGAVLFGGEERLEQMVQHLRSNATTVVGNGDLD